MLRWPAERTAQTWKWTRAICNRKHRLTTQTMGQFSWGSFQFPKGCTDVWTQWEDRQRVSELQDEIMQRQSQILSRKLHCWASLVMDRSERSQYRGKDRKCVLQVGSITIPLDESERECKDRWLVRVGVQSSFLAFSRNREAISDRQRWYDWLIWKRID